MLFVNCTGGLQSRPSLREGARQHSPVVLAFNMPNELLPYWVTVYSNAYMKEVTVKTFNTFLHLQDTNLLFIYSNFCSQNIN